MAKAREGDRKAGPEPRGELAIVERIRRRAGAPARSTGVQLGIGDDCAIVRPRAGEDLVVTTDFCLEGRHFRRDWHTPESIGHRTLARGLSDLAAMGARPVAAFLSLAMPRSVAGSPEWLEGFLRGLLGLAERAGVPLAGGDTSESPGEEVLADVVLLGAVPRGKALRRDGARAGDRLFVTGGLGGAAAELEGVARGEGRLEGLITEAGGDHPHLFPEPRLAVGRWLVRKGLASAGMDLSDGLSSDLPRLCEASGVAAEVHAALLPRHALTGELGEGPATEAALHGGEDYELLFTVAAGSRLPRRIAGVPVTEIGRMVARRRGRPLVTRIEADGRRVALRAGGWEHLR